MSPTEHEQAAFSLDEETFSRLLDAGDDPAAIATALSLSVAELHRFLDESSDLSLQEAAFIAELERASLSADPAVVELPRIRRDEQSDEPRQPKRRALLFAAIFVGVSVIGASLAFFSGRNFQGSDIDGGRVTRTQFTSADPNEFDTDPDEPAPEADEPAPEAELYPINRRKIPRKAASITFEQSLASMKSRIRTKCSKLGDGPVEIDTFVGRNDSRANAPKVKPSGPAGVCALRIVETWTFPTSQEDHEVHEIVHFRVTFGPAGLSADPLGVETSRPEKISDAKPR